MAFTVEISSVAKRLLEGGTAEVYARIENTTRSIETQNIRLEINGTQRDSRSLQLSGLGSEEVLLSWETTQPSDDGAYTATVLSDDDSDSEDFVVVNRIVRVTQGRKDPSGTPPWNEQRIDEGDIDERL